MLHGDVDELLVSPKFCERLARGGGGARDAAAGGSTVAAAAAAAAAELAAGAGAKLASYLRELMRMDERKDVSVLIHKSYVGPLFELKTLPDAAPGTMLLPQGSLVAATLEEGKPVASRSKWAAWTPGFGELFDAPMRIHCPEGRAHRMTDAQALAHLHFSVDPPRLAMLRRNKKPGRSRWCASRPTNSRASPRSTRRARARRAAGRCALGVRVLGRAAAPRRCAKGSENPRPSRAPTATARARPRRRPTPRQRHRQLEAVAPQ